MFILITTDKYFVIKTRDKILESAISLFNQFGYSNISMQRLASELGLSPGNLTYHFPKKEDLMLALYLMFKKEIGIVIPPKKENKSDLYLFDEQIVNFYHLQQRYLFFYLDLLEIERAYPVIAQQHYIHIQDQISRLEHGLRYCIALGLINESDNPENIKFLAQQLWFTAVFWPRQIRVRGITDELDHLRKTIWHQIKPYLTDAGNKKVKDILEQTLTADTTIKT